MARNDKGEVVFDEEEQKKVDEIVKERVARVKNEAPADYGDLRALDKELEDLYPNMTPAQRTEEIRKAKLTAKEAKAKREAAARADRNGTTEEQELEAMREKQRLDDLEARLQAKDQKEEEQKRAADESARQQELAKKQIAELGEAHPDLDLDKLNSDAKFIKYLKGKALNESYTLKDAYEDYAEIVGEAETKGFIDAKRKERNSTGGSDGNKGGTYGLTPRQIQLAKENGMPLAKYAEHLNKIR
jgi:hypothetical protein